MCVTPTRRAETWQQNMAAGVGSTGGEIKADAVLLAAVNDARLHPEKYPPNGNTQVGDVKAKMTGCPKPFGEFVGTGHRRRDPQQAPRLCL